MFDVEGCARCWCCCALLGMKVCVVGGTKIDNTSFAWAVVQPGFQVAHDGGERRICSPINGALAPDVRYQDLIVRAR
jgi:hypothetical protein